MRRLLRLILLIPALLAAPAGCGLLEPDGGRRAPESVLLTLQVGPETVDCVGLIPRKCLLVRELPGESWTCFYDGIEGFVHEPGFLVTLEVERREIPDPPQDGSSYEYRLVRVLAKEPAPPG